MSSSTFTAAVASNDDINGTRAPDGRARSERTHRRTSSESNAVWQDKSSTPNGTARSPSANAQHQNVHRCTGSRLRQRQSTPRASASNAIEGERIQQVFFPPFEEAGESPIMEVATHGDLQTVSGNDPLALPSRRESQIATRFKPRPAERRLQASPLEHGRSSSDCTTTLAPFRWEQRGHAWVSESDSELHLGSNILRESGLLLNSGSSFISHPTRLEQVDVTMESMEMRPRTLRRSVTTAEDAENVKVSSYGFRQHHKAAILTSRCLSANIPAVQHHCQQSPIQTQSHVGRYGFSRQIPSLFRHPVLRDGTSAWNHITKHETSASAFARAPSPIMVISRTFAPIDLVGSTVFEGHVSVSDQE